MSKINKLALIGKNISHSKSKSMYEEILGYEIFYDLIDKQEETELPSLEDLFRSYQGISITAPYKEFYLDFVALESEAQELGAINCLFQREGIVHGANTDATALFEIFSSLDLASRETVVLGDGVMARVVRYVLERLNLSAQYLSRRKNKDEFLSMAPLVESGNNSGNTNPDSAEKGLFFINCCGRGYNFSHELRAQDLFYDLNYAHLYHQSRFKESQYLDGLALLRLQAKHAVARFLE